VVGGGWAAATGQARHQEGPREARPPGARSPGEERHLRVERV